VEANVDGGSVRRFTVTLRVINATEVQYLENGGILPMVLRQAMAKA
jgi:aconitase A